MENSSKRQFKEICLSLYVFYCSVLIGWQVVSFIYLYQNLEEVEIIARLSHWSIFQSYIISIGIAVAVLFLIVRPFLEFKNIEFRRKLNMQIILNTGFLGLLLVDIILFRFGPTVSLLRLIIFFAALWILDRWGSFFYRSGITAWQHPTTYGTFIIAALLNGCALLSIFDLTGFPNTTLVYYILILLIFELFILYARFQFLSKSSQELNKIARNLFGSQILPFGIRIIIGIFMPLIFILYSMLVDGRSVEGIGILILIGTLLERYLFINGSGDVL